MVSNVNSDSSNLLQLLLSAAKSSAQSATATSSSASSSETGIGSVSSSDSTQSDFLTFLQDNFNSIDSDKDSAISQKELDTYLEKNKSPMGPPPGLIIEDASSVGSASGNELEAVSSVSDSEESESTEAKQKVFDDLDTNKDGVVSQKEIE